jgi:hypothetical protein
MPATLPVAVAAFLAAHVDTVPQLEALLLLYEGREQHWLADEIGARLYLERSQIASLMRHLLQHRLATIESGGGKTRFAYDPRWDADGLMAAVAATYRTQLIDVTRYIHSKAPGSVLDFARAFDLKGEL